jgi:hypothetical protein
MIDAEVLRLRKLRNMALRARALAQVLQSDRDCVFAKSAVICWGITRIVTGHLRAHPYRSYQQGPSRVRDLWVRMVVHARGFMASQRRPLHLYGAELQSVARELDDVRALTRSADLSDALGRWQNQIRGLVKELDSATRAETAALMPPRMETNLRVETGNRTAGAVAMASDWPYLAIQKLSARILASGV